jgi:hypothetical protein
VPEKYFSALLSRRSIRRRHFCFRNGIRELGRNFAAKNYFVTPLEQ